MSQGGDLEEKVHSFHQNLHVTKVFRKGRKKKRGRKSAADIGPSHEVQALQGQANQFYVDGNFEEARKLLTRIIQIDANVYSAWKVLGQICEDLGEYENCLLAWISAAHVRPKDAELWVTCARMTMDLDRESNDRSRRRGQAIYLYSQAIKADPGDFASIFERANLFEDAGKHHKAIKSYELLLSEASPHDMGVVKALSQCYVDM